MSAVLVLILRLALSICLYAFLGWALFSLWRGLQQQGLVLALRKAPALDLAIQHGRGGTTRRVFQQTELTLGRDHTCDLVLNDDAISARHVRLSFHHGQWWVEDLGSTNGTRLNQSALATPAVLATGDQIECGHTAIIVSIGASADPSPTTRL
jgi:pSer/pThr/pTyr-binding forkhead associated (FHA) protein